MSDTDEGLLGGGAVEGGDTGVVAESGGSNTALGVNNDSVQASWKDGLSDDWKLNPSLTTINSIEDMAKSYVNAQGLIGKKGVIIPGEGASEEDWNKFHTDMGRPQEADAYEAPQITDAPEGFEVSQDEIQNMKKLAFEMGLSPKNASKMIQNYIDGEKNVFSTQQQQNNEKVESAKKALHDQFGDKYEHNLKVAKGVLQKFADHDVYEGITGDAMLGDNPYLIRLLAKLGNSLLDDQSIMEGSANTFVDLQTNAKSELEKLEADPEVWRVLNDAGDIGHDHMVQRRNELYKKAYS
jgi:hypothetical protein